MGSQVNNVLNLDEQQKIIKKLQVTNSISERNKNKQLFDYEEQIIYNENDTSGLPYECKFCHKKFKSAIAVKSHILNHDPTILKCPFCSKKIKDLTKYVNHINSKHRKDDNNDICDKAIEDAKQYKHQQVTSSYETLDDIINDVENNQVNNINNEMESDWQENITYDSDTNLYSCNICGKQVKNLAGIRSHMVTHKQKLYRCPICGTRVKDVYTFKQHVQQHQSILYKCKHCLAVFTSIEDMKAHLCEHMIYNMSKKSDYDTCVNPRHLKKGFVCEHCHKEFIDRKDFYNHIISIQNLIPESPADHFHLEMDDKLENKYYVKCAICNQKVFDIKVHVEKYHHTDYQHYLKVYNVQDYSDLFKNNPAYKTHRNRVFFNLKPNKKSQNETDIRKRRNEMNNLEKRVKGLLPDNIIFADTKFYVPVHENKKMTQRNPDFIIVPEDILAQVNIDIANNGYVVDKDLYNKINKVIEVFGDYWHSQRFTGMTPDNHEQHVKTLYAEAGFNCLIIWEHELEDINTLQEKINKFLNN